MEDLRLSIDAYTLDTTVGKKRLEAVQPDGTLIYETLKPAGTDFAEEVQRIWTEYPEGLLDITEDGLAVLPADEDAVPKADTEAKKDEEKDSGRMMSAEEMEALRSEVFLQLNDARNELWYVLELAKTLSISSDFTIAPPPLSNQLPASHKKRKTAIVDAPAVPALQPGIEPPILPAGTYTTTPASIHLQPAMSTHDLQLALAAKEEALDECSALIDTAVEELQAMALAGERFWGSLRTLRDGQGGRDQWSIIPRPDFGRNMAEGESARDVIIPYAVDEAPPALRARSLAAFDLDPNKLDSLTFGARSHHRLRVKLQDSNGLRSSVLAEEPDELDVRALMDFVHAEAFDEELFSEIRREASALDSTVEARHIAVAVGSEEVIFELYDTRKSNSSSPTSPKCDLILHTARLSLLQLHRHRKNELITQASRLSLQPACSPSILIPILQGLQYHRMVQDTLGTLRMFADTLEKVGLVCEVLTKWDDVDSDGEGQQWLESGLSGALDGEVSLQVDGLKGISVKTTSSRPFTLHTSRASIPLQQGEVSSALTNLIADDLSAQLLEYAEVALQAAMGDDQRDGVFLDELAGVVALPTSTLSVSISPLYSTLRAILEPYDASIPAITYDPGAGSLSEWLRTVVARST